MAAVVKVGSPLMEGGVPEGRSPRVSASAGSGTEPMEQTHGRVLQKGYTQLT